MMSSLPFCAEFREVLCYGLVYPDFALLHQLHDRRGSGDNFGQRRDVENSVGRHGLAARLERANAECLAIDDLSVMSDEQHCAWNLVVVDGVEDNCVEDCQVRSVGGLGGGSRAVTEKRQTKNTAAAKPDVCRRRVVKVEWMP